VPMSQRRKLAIVAAVVIALLVVPLSVYVLLSYYVVSTDTVQHLDLVSATPPSQFKRGGEYQLAIKVTYKSGDVGYIDHEYGIEVKPTLTVMSPVLSWVSLQPAEYENGTQTPNSAAVQQPVLVITVPQTAQTGDYSLTVLAATGAGQGSSATFNFTVS